MFWINIKSSIALIGMFFTVALQSSDVTSSAHKGFSRFLLAKIAVLEGVNAEHLRRINALMAENDALRAENQGFHALAPSILELCNQLERFKEQALTMPNGSINVVPPLGDTSVKN